MKQSKVQEITAALALATSTEDRRYLNHRLLQLKAATYPKDARCPVCARYTQLVKTGHSSRKCLECNGPEFLLADVEHIGRYGKVFQPTRRIKTIDDIKPLVVVTESGCWEWLGGSRTSHGYGIIAFQGKSHRMAHRVSWCLANNSNYPDRKVDICHKCDNPPCVNPSHLFAGDRSGNMRDCVSKGRHVQHAALTCKRGHERKPENLYNRSHDGKIALVCRICHAIRAKAYKKRVAAKKRMGA